MGSQVLVGKETAFAFHKGVDGVGDFPAIKNIPAAFGDFFQKVLPKEKASNEGSEKDGPGSTSTK